MSRYVLDSLDSTIQTLMADSLSRRGIRFDILPPSAETDMAVSWPVPVDADREQIATACSVFAELVAASGMRQIQPVKVHQDASGHGALLVCRGRWGNA